MPNETGQLDSVAVPWWQPVLFAAMAGGMGWGIRGQYGHETGAMIAGVLVSLTLVFLLCREHSGTQIVRAAALCTIAMGIGGTETYGVTLGLTHNPEMIGNWGALLWGMVGCLIKGALWIGFAGLFLGIGLGGAQYRPREVLLLSLSMIGAFYIGSWLLNSPFDIEGRRLPAIHFSNFWRWIPESDTRPRHESWGGLLFALTLALFYVAVWKKDVLGRNMGLWGILGGALGFPLGQSLQAFHAWNPEIFQRGLWVHLDPYMNWWNNMETTFGFTMGAILGLGLWLNRHRIEVLSETEACAIPAWAEALLMAAHLYLLVHVQFVGGAFGAWYDSGLMLTVIPFLGVIGGRIWPWFQVLAITLLPIALKTVRELVLENPVIDPVSGWSLYFVVPMAAAILVAGWYAWRSYTGIGTTGFVTVALLLNIWLYFGLNYAFFRYPLPWRDWTGRTPNGIVFTLFAIGLTAMVILGRAGKTQNSLVGPDPTRLLSKGE